MRFNHQALSFWTLILALGLLLCSASASVAQESEAVVIDEVVAQVNNDVITLSMVKREMREAIKARVDSGMSEQQATQEVTQRQADLIATLINEQLLLQRGKDLNFAEEVESEVNKRMLEVARQQNIATIAELDAALISGGLNPVEIRQTLRTEIMKSMVLSREVDARIFYGATDVELKKYFETHKDKFRKPESVTLSEIFLSTAGKTQAEVEQIRAKATQIVTQARGGADFGALAAAHSDREVNGKRIAVETKGKVGTFQVPDLNEEILKAIKNVNTGGVADPIMVNGGIEILRVDERTPAGTTAVYNEQQVRSAITNERAEAERNTYMQSLRDDAYIKVSAAYRDAVVPLLKLKATQTNTNSTTSTNTNNSGRP